MVVFNPRLVVRGCCFWVSQLCSFAGSCCQAVKHCSGRAGGFNLEGIARSISVWIQLVRCSCESWRPYSNSASWGSAGQGGLARRDEFESGCFLARLVCGLPSAACGFVDPSGWDEVSAGAVAADAVLSL